MNQANPFSAPESPSEREGVGHLLDPPVTFAGELEPADWRGVGTQQLQAISVLVAGGLIFLAAGWYYLWQRLPNAKPWELLVRVGTVEAFLMMCAIEFIIMAAMFVYSARFLRKSIRKTVAYQQVSDRSVTGVFDGDGLMICNSESSARYPWKSMVILFANNHCLTVQFNNQTVMPIPNRLFSSIRAIDRVIESAQRLKINAFKRRFPWHKRADGLPPVIDVDDWKCWSIDYWPIESREEVEHEQDFNIERVRLSLADRLRWLGLLQLLFSPSWMFAICWLLGVFKPNDVDDFFPPVFGIATWIFLVMINFSVMKLSLPRKTQPQQLHIRLRPGGFYQEAGLELWTSWNMVEKVIRQPDRVGYMLITQPVPTLYSRAQFASDEDFERFGETLQQFFGAWKASHTN